MKLFTLFLETSFHNMWFGTYALFKKMSYLYHLHGKFRKALTWERTENVSNLIWKYFLMVTYFKFTQDIPPFCVKAGGYVYFILLSSAATIEFFSFSLPTRRFMKSLSLSWHKKWCSWDKLTSSETFYVVLSTFNERTLSYWNWLFINTCWNWTLLIGGKAYILALLTCWELLGRFKLNVIALQRFYLTQILKIFYANFNDFIISLLYLYTVTCYSSCSQYAVMMMKTFCLVPESKSMVSELYFFIGCFDGLLWLAIQPIFSLTHFQPMFHF